MIYILVLWAVANSCNRTTEQAFVFEPPDTVSTIKYASGFSIACFPNFKQVTVYHSWKDNIPLAIYYLVKDSSIATPSDGTKIKIPLQSLGITSCTHVEFLHLLDELSSVKGSTSPEIIYNEILQRKYKENQLVHLGDAFRIDFERLLLLNPDALMLTSYNSSADENTRRLQNAGVNLIYNQEWTEETLLGRAEWIKFVASFYDKDLLADSLFDRIEENYQKAKSLANSAEEKPDILAGGNFKGTWYMPSGKVFMGKLFLDAGGRYYYADDTSKGSLPLSFETVLLHQQHADVWLNAQAESLQELIAQDERHRLFDAVKNKQVYNFNARMKEKGANDFWESGVARPDRILSDVIWALHPELLPDYQPFYIQKLK